MEFVNIILYTSIAILYNLFVHNIASFTYRDLQYEAKHANTTVMILVFGIMGIIIAKFGLDKNKRYKNSVVSKGLKLGGFLLIMTSLFVNWESIGEEIKIILIGAILGVVIWYSYSKNKETTTDDKDKIIDELLNDIEES